MGNFDDGNLFAKISLGEGLLKLVNKGSRILYCSDNFCELFSVKGWTLKRGN